MPIVFAAILFAITTADGAARPSQSNPLKSKYAELVRVTHWAWKEEQANILYSMSQASSPYDIAVLRPHDKPGLLRFTILDGRRQVYSWSGHARSVFVVKDRRLHYVNFGASVPGGEVVAVDLTTGKELWRSKLRAIEQLSGHSIYGNSINISDAGEVLQIFGNESAGRYCELKDAKTGETLGHKVFSEEKPEQSTPENGK